MDHSKYPAPDSALVSVADGAFEIADKLGEFRAWPTDLGLEGGQVLAAIRDDPVAPSLGVGEHALRSPVVGPQTVEQGTDRFGIDFAHQLADVLALPALRLVCAHPAEFVDRLAEALVQIEAIEQVVRQL